MSEKATNVQIKTLKDLYKALRAIAQDHFNNEKTVWLLGSEI